MGSFRREGSFQNRDRFLDGVRQKLEKLMGYKLIVVDPKTKDVLYGLGTLEKVATAKE